MNQEEPFFSICIPTFNSVDLLSRLIKSILKQSFKNFEIIISDDSSNDEVFEYCKSLENNVIIYFKHKSVVTATENWNFGLKKSKGKYKMLIHHDDYFSDYLCLEKIYNEHLKNGEMMVYFMSFINENNTRKFYYNKFSIHKIFKNPDNLLYVNYFSTPSCIVLNQKVDLFYNEELKWLVDVDFYSRLFKKYSKIKLISNVCMIIGGGIERITNTITEKNILNEYYFLTKKNIFKYKLGVYFITIMKFKIILIEYFNLKFNVHN